MEEIHGKVPQPQKLPPMEQAEAIQHQEDVKEAPTELNTIMRAERGAFSLAPPGQPKLLMPASGVPVIRFDTHMLTRKVLVYKDSIWDDFLKAIAEQEKWAKLLSKKSDAAAASQRDLAMQKELQRDLLLGGHAAKLVLKLATLAAVFNPERPALQLKERAAELGLGEQVQVQAASFLADPKRMRALREAAQAHAGKEAPDTAVLELFMSIRVAMAMAALYIYSSIQSEEWSYDQERLLGDPENETQGMLQGMFVEDRRYLADQLGPERMALWTQEIMRELHSAAQEHVGMVYSFLEEVVADAEPPPPSFSA